MHIDGIRLGIFRGYSLTRLPWADERSLTIGLESSANELRAKVEHLCIRDVVVGQALILGQFLLGISHVWEFEMCGRVGSVYESALFSWGPNLDHGFGRQTEMADDTESPVE